MNKINKIKNFVGSKNQCKIVIAVVIAVFAAILTALSVFAALPSAHADDGLQRATLRYSDAQKTVVVGIDETAAGFDKTAPYEVYIPSGVKEIGHAAFIGQKNLTSLAFDPNVSIEKIGDFAFGGTGLKSAELPSDLKTIGAAAFADNALTLVTLPDTLESVGKRAFGNNRVVLAVNLPDNDKTVYGEDVFDVGSYLIANGRASFDKLTQVETLTDYADSLTYIITINYNYKGSVIDTEQRLFGKDYNVVLTDGVWTVNENEKLGTAVTGTMKWFDGENNIVLESDVSEFLKTAESDTLTLYAFESDGKLFVARNDLEYSGKEYKGTELNSLLYDASDKITPLMTVTVDSYSDPDGNSVEKTTESGADNENFPSAVGRAGTYGMKVNDDGVEYSFVIEIARKKVDLGEYTSSLAWQLKNVGGSDVNAELLSANGTILYLYTRLADETVFPSLSILSDNEIDSYGLGSEFNTISVKYSVARYRGEEVVLTVALKGNDAYSVTYSGDYYADEIGKYTAKAALTANPNYLLELDGTPVDASERGIKIDVSKDGKTASVSKDWYVVDVGNWAVAENGSEYKIADREYGETLAVDVPRLKYGDVAPQDYGSSLDPVSLSLIYNGTTIIGNETFTRLRFTQYINDAMPAGEYRLRISARSVITEEYAESDTEHLDPTSVYHSGFEETVTFTVNKKAMPTIVTDKIDGVLRERTFTYEWDGAAHYYYDSLAADINGALEFVSTVSRVGTVWADPQYDPMFGGFGIVFNLSRMQNDIYYSAEAMPVAPVDPDKYTVFYKVVAPNYTDSAESGENGRTDYYFEVVNVRAVEIPQAYAKTYTGSLLAADIADTLVYTVTENNGGISVGEYDVVITFREPDFYMWQGQEINNKTASVTVKFAVTPATNRWSVEPGVTFWVEGSYDASENAVFGSARFGSTVIVITDSADNVIYNSATGINKLATAKAGMYRLSATVNSSADFDSLTYSAFVQIFEKPGLPWWAILLIVVGALAVAATVILILWKKGVFQILTGKLVLAIRTKATIDATIAAVRANRVAMDAKASIAEAEARDAAEERAKARKEAAEAERNKTAEEKAAELEAKAQSESERAERIKARAETLLAKASEMKESVATDENTDLPEQKPQKKASGKKKTGPEK